MKKDYQTPESRIRLFRTQDVILASTTEEIKRGEHETDILLEWEA